MAPEGLALPPGTGSWMWSVGGGGGVADQGIPYLQELQTLTKAPLDMLRSKGAFVFGVLIS